MFGRTVGTKRSGDDGWSCVAYDARSRMVQADFADFNDTGARTVIYDYSVNGNDPRVTSVTEGSHTVSSEVDLLGRAVSSIDYWGTVTNPTYQPLTGRVLSIITESTGGQVLEQSFVYDRDGKVDSVLVDEVEVANPVYATDQLLESVTYANGTTLTGLTRNQAGTATGMTWNFPASITSHPAQTAYTGDFETGADGWASGSNSLVAAHTSTPRNGAGAFETTATQTAGGTVTATKTVTGLMVGRSYTASIWVDGTSSVGVSDLTLGVAGINASSPVSAPTGFQELTYSFTATSTTHDLAITYEATDDVGSLLVWDDATVTSAAWQQQVVPASSITESVTRSQSGRIVQNTLVDTQPAVTETSSYTYDSAGRLVQAVIPGHTLTYGFGTATCGANLDAGKNGNRTSSSDAHTGVGTSGLLKVPVTCLVRPRMRPVWS